MSNPIAKFREPGIEGKWFLTDFTMEQVEGRIKDLESRLIGSEQIKLERDFLFDRLTRTKRWCEKWVEEASNRIKDKIDSSIEEYWKAKLHVLRQVLFFLNADGKLDKEPNK